MPAWASRMAKSTATIKSMAIKIRSVVADMAIPFYLRMKRPVPRAKSTVGDARFRPLGRLGQATGLQPGDSGAAVTATVNFCPSLSRLTIRRMPGKIRLDDARVGTRRVARISGVERRATGAVTFPDRR